MNGTFSDIQETFRDIHKGKMGFLIATGPSTCDVKPDDLRPYVTMGVNETILKFESLTYYFVCDWFTFNAGMVDKLAGLNTTTKLILACDKAPLLNPMAIPPERIYCIPRKADGNMNPNQNDAKVVCGSSTVHSAAHLLYIMGCDPIVLIGCDCQIKNGLYAFWHQSPYREKITKYYKELFGDDPGKTFDSVLQNRGCAPLDAMLGTHHHYWLSMSAANPKLPIVDASQGRLKCFPNVTLKQVLDTYGSRKL